MPIHIMEIKLMLLSLKVLFIFFFASVIAYFFGEFINSTILAKLKVLTDGNYFSPRVMASTAVGVAIDNVIFCNIAFWGIMQARYAHAKQIMI
ncbi:VUT family protein [Legionella sp.]|uniref:VUT family protein n=1 Tax=Legionella sp. TaxID=459 RepID=UPI0039E6E084